MTNLEFLRIKQRIEMTLLKMRQAIDVFELENPKHMVDPKVAALIAEFDAATDAIAARIQKLIEAGGLSADSQAALQSEVDKLNLLGQDPNNPVPPQA